MSKVFFRRVDGGQVFELGEQDLYVIRAAREQFRLDGRGHTVLERILQRPIQEVSIDDDDVISFFTQGYVGDLDFIMRSAPMLDPETLVVNPFGVYFVPETVVILAE